MKMKCTSTIQLVTGNCLHFNLKYTGWFCEFIEHFVSSYVISTTGTSQSFLRVRNPTSIRHIHLPNPHSQLRLSFDTTCNNLKILQFTLLILLVDWLNSASLMPPLCYFEAVVVVQSL